MGRFFSLLGSRPAIIAAIAVCCGTAGAQSPGTGSEPAQFLALAAGVYKVQFTNGDVEGNKYRSENILEVVPVAHDAAYVRMDLQFFNGHSGGISGIAVYGRHSLVYDNGEPGNNHCVIEYVWTQDRVVTGVDYGKTPGCRNYHGARGNLNGVEFALGKRRKIRYMQRLRDSLQFKQAMREYQGRSR